MYIIYSKYIEFLRFRNSCYIAIETIFGPKSRLLLFSNKKTFLALEGIGWFAFILYISDR